MVMRALVIPTLVDETRLITEGNVAVTFFTDACPSGWTELTTARGRYLVGVPDGGTLLATVGTALTNSENRPVGQHTHVFTADGHQHDFQMREVAGDTATITGNVLTSIDNNAGADVQMHATLAPAAVAHADSIASQTVTGTNANSGGVANTNAPYIQLIPCTKD